MEYVYKLNLPPLNKVLREDVLPRFERSYDHPIFTKCHPSELIKPEFLTINGVEWAFVINFYKPPGYVGLVHTDDVNPKSHAWGINWIWGAAGAIKYWHSGNITPIKQIPAAVTGELIGYYPSDIPCDVSYHMEPGVYLVNAKPPHQPISLGSRHCISLRPLLYDTPWETIVDRFKDYII
jgi:hypothetical protein